MKEHLFIALGRGRDWLLCFESKPRHLPTRTQSPSSLMQYYCFYAHFKVLRKKNYDLGLSRQTHMISWKFEDIFACALYFFLSFFNQFYSFLTHWKCDTEGCCTPYYICALNGNRVLNECSQNFRQVFVLPGNWRSFYLCNRVDIYIITHEEL